MRTIERDIVGAFIFSEDGKLLLGKSRNGGVYKDLWIVPGGGIDEGETKIQALIRELNEEIGLDLSSIKIQEIGKVFWGESEKTLKETGERVLVKMRFYNFQINIPNKSSMIKLTTDDDFISPRWFNISELQNLPMSPPTVENLKVLGYLNDSA